MTLDARHLVGDPRLAAVKLIAERWDLRPEEVRQLVDPSVGALYGGANDAVSGDAQSRLSCLLGIFSALHERFPIDVQAAEWLRNFQCKTLFGGRSPLQVVIAGSLLEQMELRYWLESGNPLECL
ncbi:hypothetical protein [[Pseudomonas] boreopolis]|uniref:hypothetical protein n=1 Tax=Xanthomonas boreopolis TaxID=86183 RepID=UPI003D9FB8DB